MSTKSEIIIQSFYVFNSIFCLQEGEEEKKVLYYFPTSIDIDTKIRNVGLVEAVIKFTETFHTQVSCSSLHTQKTRQLYFEPEKNYWMVMTVNVPYVCKVKDGSEYYEYQGDEVQDTVYQAVLQQAYRMFRLFSGTYTSIVENNGVDVLQRELEHFYSRYLLTLKPNTCDILNVFDGMQYLPLNNLTFLNATCFINLVESDFPFIKFTAFMYNDHLIWSGIEPSDIQPVYQYMIGTLLPAHMETELQGGSMPRHQSSPFSSTHYGRFVTGPTNLKDSLTIGKVPKVYINNGTYYLIVYRALSASVMLFVDASTELKIDLFRDLDEFMGPELTTLVSEIAEYCSHQISTHSNLSDNSPRFIYFNKLNLAYKSTVHLDNKQSGNVTVSSDALKLITDLNADKISQSFYGETVVKTMNDYWVAGKFSNMREFYVAIHNKNASLIEVSEDIKKLCDTELKGIFFQL